MIGKLNHIAIAVPDLKSASKIYKDILGANVSDPTPMPDHGVTTVFVELPNTKIELLEPLGDESPINNYLLKNPKGGMHHICYEVDDIYASRDKLINDGDAEEVDYNSSAESNFEPFEDLIDNNEKITDKDLEVFVGKLEEELVY